MRIQLFVHRAPALAVAVAAALVVAGLAHGSPARGSTSADPPDDHLLLHNADPIGTDAAEIARQQSISVEDARAAILRQERVGRMEALMEAELPLAYGGLFLEYSPEYRLTILVTPGRSQDVRAGIARLGFSDLEEYIVLRETEYTRQTLIRAVDRVRDIGRGRVAGSTFDIRNGTVTVTGATEADVNAIRAAIEKSRASIPAAAIDVGQADFHEESSSFGGLWIDALDGSPCTSGFSVRRTTDNTMGMSSAAHCDPDGVLHNSTLTFMSRKYGGSHDVQWFRTSLADENKIKDSSTTWRYVTSRTHRTDMVVGQGICNYGRKTFYKCGYVYAKNYQPPTGALSTDWTATFIDVEGADTQQGDSGGPWFLGNSAYGIHVSSYGQFDHPYFMAQNYMGALDLVVKIQ